MNHIKSQQSAWDHRELGKKLELFFFHDQAPGMPYWLPRGVKLIDQLSRAMAELLHQEQYENVQGPVLNSQSLLEASGHWQQYQDDMFILKKSEEDFYGMKAMNCPNAVRFYQYKKRSFRDLPLRLADFGMLFRNEASGALSGLFRIQQFRQDDAHIFLSEADLEGEFQRIFHLIRRVYKLFGLQFEVRVGGRPAKSIGEKERWNLAEKVICKQLELAKIDYSYEKGEGAFYGPKIDLLVKDAKQRQWQLGSVQLDYLLPERFNCDFINSRGKKERPVLIHRAILGSFERFLGIYLEHVQGWLPFWLAPEQVRIIPVNQNFYQAGMELKSQFESLGIRVQMDASDRRINYRVRQAAHQRIPGMIVLGQKELDSRHLNLKMRNQEHCLAWEEMINYVKCLAQPPLVRDSSSCQFG